MRCSRPSRTHTHVIVAITPAILGFKTKVQIQLVWLTQSFTNRTVACQLLAVSTQDASGKGTEDIHGFYQQCQNQDQGIRLYPGVD